MRQQKRHWCIEQSFGLCGRGRVWDDLGEWHWNTYNIIYETSRQSRFDARYWMLGAGALGRPRGMVWGGRREEGSEWGTHVYLWQIHFDIWQNQYNIVKFKNKIKIKNKSFLSNADDKLKSRKLLPFFKKSSFIYLFLSVLGLHCREGFSLVVLSGDYASCGVRASHCGGFSLLQSMGSRAQAQ